MAHIESGNSRRRQDSDALHCPLFMSVPDLVAHDHRHAMVHRLLLFCACDANHELAEIVDTQRSSRSRRASTDSSFSFGDLVSRGNGVEVDAEHELSPHPPESVDGGGQYARR